MGGSLFLSVWEARKNGEPGACVPQDGVGGREGMPTDCIRKAEIRNCMTGNRMTG